MLLGRVEETKRHLRDFVARHFKVELQDLNAEAPPRTELGDLAFPFAFELAKTLRRSPREIASEVVANIEIPPYVDHFSAAGAGYVNVFFKRELFLQELGIWLTSAPPEARGEKIIVEHTNINPNKAAHIGHLRNAALGDTFVRLLRARGRAVEVQNYIDNTGVQVADVVVGFRYLREMTLEAVRAVEEPFDYYCWDLYAEVSHWYRKEECRLQHRERTLKEIEEGQHPTAELAEHISERIVLAHLKTMLRIGVRYELLPRESEILNLKFWEDAFRQLKERAAIVYRDEGPNKGCWVMPFPGEDGEQEDEKIIVRSNGTVTYVGKDIAYQLWKFGLLGKNFHYRPFCQYQNETVFPFSGGMPDDKTVWQSSAQPGAEPEPDFGRAKTVYNVIDVRQSYLQKVVVEGLRRLNFAEQADRSVHFSYEMVALSPACCAELGIALAGEEQDKPYVEVSGRKGLGVKADDLIDKLIEKALKEVDARQPDAPADKRREIARQIAVGSLRYFLLKYTRTSVIAFDFGEALSFEGETGPYLQYSVVRANNIFRKLEAGDPQWNTSLWKGHRRQLWQKPESISGFLQDDEIWGLLLQVARIDETIEQALRSMEIAYLAKHAFTLAQQFNLFYHRYHILSEADPLKKTFYLTVADTARQGLMKTLNLLGIQVPERM